MLFIMLILLFIVYPFFLDVPRESFEFLLLIFSLPAVAALDPVVATLLEGLP